MAHISITASIVASSPPVETHTTPAFASYLEGCYRRALALGAPGHRLHVEISLGSVSKGLRPTQVEFEYAEGEELDAEGQRELEASVADLIDCVNEVFAYPEPAQRAA